MKRSVTIKIAVLIPVILTTHYLTTEIRARWVEDKFESPRVEITFLGRNKSIPKPNITSNRPPVATGYLKGHDIRVVGNEVQITASAYLEEDMRLQGNRSVFLWRVRVHRDEDVTLEVDRPYVEQLFEIHPSGSMSPTFAESFQLPAGRHRVQLTLYRMPKDYDLANLNDEKKDMAARYLHIPQVVTIE